MNIKELRLSMGLSQSQFARHYDMSVRTLQQWEQGISNPPAYVMHLLEKDAERDVTKKSYIAHLKLTKPVKWRVVDGVDFYNCNLIHPLQQRKVSELIDDMKTCDVVKKIVIFGSSVTDSCHVGSDVDIYVEVPTDTNPIRQVHNFKYDLWNNYRVDERLEKEIKSKGVVVYDADTL